MQTEVMNEDKSLHIPASSLRDDFNSAWLLTEGLFSSLKDESALLRPPVHGLRHPLNFYLGHIPVFYINKLVMAGLLERGLDEKFEKIYAVGVDENSWDDMSKNESEWPSLATVREYRERVYDIVSELIERNVGEAPLTSGDPRWALVMGIEHERIHIETTSVLIREMPIEHVRRPQHFPQLHPTYLRRSPKAPEAGLDYPLMKWVEFAGGRVSFGRARNAPGYAWDCDYGSGHASVDPFCASRTLISNGEFYEFVQDGGYRNQAYWSEEGWAWRQYRNRSVPMFWVADSGAASGDFRLRTCFEEIAMAWSWPVIANFHESKAYVAWRSARDARPTRLISEAEHHCLRARNRKKIQANHGLRFSSESPVDGDRAEPADVCDVFGNVWQWCEDVFAPLEGFLPHRLYPDYSAPAFDGRHQLLLGGSFASSGSFMSPWTRNNFRRHFYQHAGIRIVR
jgi:5-histidylcysteine sulfoxide synthase